MVFNNCNLSHKTLEDQALQGLNQEPPLMQPYIPVMNAKYTLGCRQHFTGHMIVLHSPEDAKLKFCDIWFLDQCFVCGSELKLPVLGANNILKYRYPSYTVGIRSNLVPGFPANWADSVYKSQCP